MIDKKISKKKKPTIKWFLISLLALALFIGFNYFKAQKQRNERMAVMNEQRQVLIESWKAQGLSDEEIEEKLESTRPSGLPAGGNSGMGIMKVITGGRRSGSR